LRRRRRTSRFRLRQLFVLPLRLLFAPRCRQLLCWLYIFFRPFLSLRRASFAAERFSLLPLRAPLAFAISPAMMAVVYFRQEAAFRLIAFFAITPIDFAIFSASQISHIAADIASCRHCIMMQ